MDFFRRFRPALLILGLVMLPATSFALSANDLIKQGIAALRDGKGEQALELFTRAHRLDPNSAKPHYFIAEALERLGAPDSARVEYETAIRMQPKYVEALTGLGKLLRKQGKIDEGTARLEEAVRYKSKDVFAVYALGQAYLADKRYQDAETIFRKGTLLKQGRELFLAGLALSLEGQGDLKGSEELFIRARETNPNNLHVRRELGGFYTRKNIPVLAAPEYGRATELDPKDPELQYLYGKALVGMNEFNAGLAAFIRASQVDSTFADSYLEAGRLFYRAKRYQEAGDNFRKYVNLRPEEAAGYAELGRALSFSQDSGDRQEALVVLARADEIKPDQKDVLRALCRLYAEQGEEQRENALAYCDRYANVADSLTAEENLRLGGLFAANRDSAKAVERLALAVEQDSALAKDAYFQIGTLLFLKRDWERAIPYFEQTLEADSSFVPAMLNLGLCRLQLQDKSGAIEALREALAYQPNDARALVWIGQTLLTMEADSLPVAYEAYQQAMGVDSTNTDAVRGAGLSLLLMDNCADAITYLERATTMQPDHVQGHIWLGQTLTKCRDVARAKSEFNKALDIDPTNQEASRGLQLIREWEEQQQARNGGAQP